MDQQILSKMHQVNQMEINVGKLAQQKSDDPEVQRYGRNLVRDHEMGDRKVTMLAKQLNLTLMTPQPQTPEQQKMQMQMRMVDKLKTLSGKDFDNAFLSAMVQGHAQAISMLKDAEGKLPEQSPVRMLISKLLPILQQHQQLAEDFAKAREVGNLWELTRVHIRVSPVSGAGFSDTHHVTKSRRKLLVCRGS
jgi:predicted outer membrane protein